MGIDPARVLAAPATTTPGSWTKDEVIRYHLGIGAGADPLDPGQLEYVLEDRLKVLPTFGVLVGSAGASPALRTPGLEFDRRLMLHGQQEIRVHAPIPPEGAVSHSGRVAELWDKGNATVAVVEVTTVTAAGSLLATNRFGMFLRGAGGFGGDPGPKSTALEPTGAPDKVVEVTTLPQQALLYRTCGDRNPIHSDPVIARGAGFDRAILHGQCWYGMACRALVDTFYDGDVTAVGSWSARFAGIVYPGETLVLSCWRDGEALHVTGDVAERSARVLTGGVMTPRH